MKISSPFLATLTVLSLLGAGCWQSTPTTGEPTPKTPQAPPTTLGMWAEANGIVVVDQKPGWSVIVSSVIMEHNGWILIHKDDGGKPGSDIGMLYLPAGEHSQVTMNLIEKTVDGMTYYAKLYRDNDNRVFQISKDKPVLSTVLGGEIMASFKADGSIEQAPIVSP